MKPEHRNALLLVLSRIDRIETEINAVIAEPGDTDNVPWAGDVRELIVEMRANVEEKLDRVTERDRPTPCGCTPVVGA